MPELGFLALCEAFRVEYLPLAGGIMHAARDVLGAEGDRWMRDTRIELTTVDGDARIRRTTRHTVSCWKSCTMKERIG